MLKWVELTGKIAIFHHLICLTKPLQIFFLKIPIKSYIFLLSHAYLVEPEMLLKGGKSHDSSYVHKNN